MGHRRTLKHTNLLFAALADLLRQPMRSLVVTLCLTAILFPLVTALAVSEGLRFQADIAVQEGADLYVSAERYGGNGAISTAFIKRLSALEGISRVTARVVGRTYFADRVVSVVGLDKPSLRALMPLVRGTLPDSPGDVLIGQSIAEAFAVESGIRFTLTANNRKVFRCVGTLSPTCLWGSDVLIMHFDDANAFFRMKGVATQLLCYRSTPSGPLDIDPFYHPTNQGAPPLPSIQIADRPRIQERLKRGYEYTGGIFVVLFIIGAALAISAFLVTSGFGLKELDKEIGLLKAFGWRTSEILEKVTMENFLLSLAAVSISVLLSMVWIKGLNGILIAQFYVAEVGVIPHVHIPSRYLPSHALFYLAFALGVTLAGSLFSTWIKARITPAELMR